MPKLITPLSPKARMLCEYKVEHSLLTNKQLAEALGLNIKTVQHWVKDENFLNLEHDLCMIKFKSAQGIALKTMIDAAKKGNTKAAQYLLDNTGFKLPEEQNVNLDAEINIDYGD